MSAMHTPDAPARSTDTRHLYRIINTVSSTLDLDRVLRAIVDLVSDAVDCHACFVYVVEPDASLVLRAVSDPYTALVGRLRFEQGEGLAGWVAQHDEPVFLAEGALTDPRAKVVPEAEEVATSRSSPSPCGARRARSSASSRFTRRRPGVHAGRLGLHDARGESGRGRDRERPPLRADTATADACRGAGRPVARRVGGLDARAAAPRGGPPRAAPPPRRGVRGLRGLGRRRQVPARCGVARRPGHRDAAHRRRDGRRAGPGGG